MEQNIIFLGAISYCLGQNINSPALDWIQTNENGAYRFGYATGDEGRHYHIQSATSDNTVAGKFGYKEPGTNRDLQTSYTAGKRGFRARGPHIARRMDLSQIKPPFSRPDDDGQYHPELDNYFDPNEDRGFDYSYRTSNHIKQEHANRVGDVQGRYSYVDDIGFRHNVNYVAGSKTGFVVINPVPDTFAQARGGPLYYVGKSGGAKVRGFSAVQKTGSGAYRFLASGPDHKRSEISDASGNRRGIYTYLDDKGVQHTIEYIAGPKIGYKVINNRRGVNYNPILPFFVDSSTVLPLFPASSTSGREPGTGKPLAPFPTPTPVPSSTFGPFPPASSFGGGAFPESSSGGSDGIGGDGGGGGGASGSGGSDDDEFSFPIDGSLPPFDGLLPSKPLAGSGGLPPAVPPTSSSSPSKKPLTPLFKPTTVKPSLFTPSKRPTSADGGDKADKGKPFPSPAFPTSDFPSPTFPSPSPYPLLPDPFSPSIPKWDLDYDYFLRDTFIDNKDWSKPVKGPSKKPSSGPRPLVPFPNFFPSPLPKTDSDSSDPFQETFNTAESEFPFKSTQSKKTDDKICNCTTDDSGKTNKVEPHERDDQSGADASSASEESTSGAHGKDSPKHLFKGYKGFGGHKKKDWHKIKHENGYLAIPSGVAVRAHVQSLDIVPYSRKFMSPGEALKHHEIKEKEKSEKH